MPSLIEKYRPKLISEMIGIEDIKQSILSIIKRGDIPHIMLSGPSGTGKTTMAYCLGRELLKEYFEGNFIELNASDERGIETIREKVKSLSNMSVLGGRRIIFLDEADNLTEDAQNALRRIMETSRDTTFILSINRENKIIDPIKSRCSIFYFRRHKPEDVQKLIIKVIQEEGIQLKTDVPEDKEIIKTGLAQLVRESDGDMRKVLGELEKIVQDGKVISKESMSILLRRTTLTYQALQRAVSGDFDTAKSMMEDAYINERYNTNTIIQELKEAIEQLEVKNDKMKMVKIRLFIKLAETEYRIKIGGTPIVQLVSFISFAWLSPHLNPATSIGAQ